MRFFRKSLRFVIKSESEIVETRQYRVILYRGIKVLIDGAHAPGAHHLNLR